MAVAGFISTSDTNAEQFTVNQQLGVQGGSGVTSAYGATSKIKGRGDVFGALAGGNIGSGAKIKGGKAKGKGAQSNISIVTNDPTTAQLSIAASADALRANQELSTLALGYGALTANQALQTLQTLQAQSVVAQAGGSPELLAGESASERRPAVSKSVVVLLIVGAAIAIYFYNT